MKSLSNYIIEAIILAGLVVGFLFVLSKYDRKLEISEQNYKAAMSEMEEIKLKNGELITSNDSYIFKIKELEEQFDISKKEAKDLEKKLGASLAYISKIESEVRIDTIETVRDTIIYKNDTTEIKFKYKDEWLNFNGVTTLNNLHSTTSIYDLNILTGLKVGVTDNYKIFVQSSNPYIKFTDIEGAVIDGSKFAPKPKRLKFGVQGGFGGMYNIIDKNISIGPYVGVGLQWNF